MKERVRNDQKCRTDLNFKKKKQKNKTKQNNNNKKQKQNQPHKGEGKDQLLAGCLKVVLREKSRLSRNSWTAVITSQPRK